MNMIMFFVGAAEIMVLGFVLYLLMYVIQIHIIKKNGKLLGDMMRAGFEENVDFIDEIYDFIDDEMEYRRRRKEVELKILEQMIEDSEELEEVDIDFPNSNS